ncbi:transcription termination factor MTERF6, chloroplastic/mitochondrial isoform X1 [Cryptomeria japonica]|uniref:transcription termination factor MTERF6, chloroplastic/mitochondrial isoform X1 n=1 Tax=Cryptomeria japonica TaxID=3369 RepID=UPI0025ACBD5D|nr:transcription termination factor MTERF6, chloroplastic/mitochondrial isoform X1 [Cryptomeria japonica]
MMIPIAKDHGCLVHLWGGFTHRYHYREQGMGLLPLGGCHHLHNYQTSLFLQANKMVVTKAVNQAHSPLDSSLSLPLHIQPLPQLVLSSPICYGWKNANKTGGGKNLLQSQFQVLQKCFSLKEKKPLNANTARVENSSIAIEEPNSEERGRMKEESETEHERNDRNRFIHIHEELTDFQIFEGMDMSLAAYRRCLKYASETNTANVTGVISILTNTGLSKPEIGFILSKIPSVLKIKPIELSKIFNVLSQLGYPKKSLPGICLQFPGFLEYDADELSKVFEFLQSVGMTKEELVKVLHNKPQVFRYPAEKVSFSVNCLLQAGVPNDCLCKILLRVSRLFSPVIQHNLKARLEFLVRIGLKPDILGKAILRRPNILGIDSEASSSSYTYLKQYVTDDDIVKIVSRYPDALLINPVRMGQIFGYLIKRGVKPRNLGKVIARGPCLLAHTIATMESNIDYLRSLGAKDDIISKAITRGPQIILCCNYEKNLHPKFRFFYKKGFSKQQVAQMFLVFPSMFGQSIEKSLQPKFDFLANEMAYTIDEVAGFPQYFGFSLEHRIKPRYRQIEETGIFSSLSGIFGPTEEDFELKMLRLQKKRRLPFRKNEDF